MRGFIQAVARTTVAMAQLAQAAAKIAVNVVYSPTMQAKTAQGATEVSNALFSGAAYSPASADRAAFQAKDHSKAAEI